MDHPEPVEHCAEISDVIGQVPPWILRWGIAVVCAIGLLGVITAWWIHYPDVISARIELITARPPVRMIAQTSARIARLAVTRDGQRVQEGEVLAVLESTADIDAVQALQHQLDADRERPEPERAAAECGRLSSNLGTLEAPYAEFARRCRERVLQGRRLARHDRLAELRAQIGTLDQLGAKLARQQQAVEQQVGIAADRVVALKQLLERGFISSAELAQAQAAVLAKEAELEKAKADAIDNRARIEETRRAMVDVQYDTAQRSDDIELAFEQAEGQLRSALADWERSYVLRAPVAGEAWLFNYWSTNQYVKQSEEVMLVVPERTELVGKVLLPEQNSGKVAVGQRVNIRVDSYRVSEVGLVRGAVEGIAPVARDGFYLVNVGLPDGLRTTYGAALRYRPQMAGTADIVTEDLRLLQRAFFQLRQLFGAGAGAA